MALTRLPIAHREIVGRELRGKPRLRDKLPEISAWRVPSDQATMRQNTI
jgi:hypothetical protein